MNKKKNAPRFSSLRQFSWSGKKEKDKDELLIEATALEWYDQKHRRPSPEETEFVNSIPIGSCPHCGMGIIARNGKGPSGIQRYVCRCCGKFFTPLTNRRIAYVSHLVPDEKDQIADFLYKKKN